MLHMLAPLYLQGQKLKWHDHDKMVLRVIHTMLDGAAEAEFTDIFIPNGDLRLVKAC